MSSDPGGPWLLADVGGTKARFALSAPSGAIGPVTVLYNREYASLADAAQDFLARMAPAEAPRIAAFSVACPVDCEEIHLTNYGWRFTREGLRAALGVGRVIVINDFTAVALSVPALGAEDLAQIGGQAPVPLAAKAVIGPGTGLGVSGLVHCGAHWVALASEGGHTSLPASSEEEARAHAILRRSFGRVSAERALSGPGLENLYNAVVESAGRQPERLGARDISERAAAKSDPDCMAAARLFSSLLGTVAGDLALTIGAKGGVYIAGGVVHNMGAAFDRGLFRECFDDKGRLGAFNAPIPVYEVVRQWPAFLGLMAAIEAEMETG